MCLDVFFYNPTPIKTWLKIRKQNDNQEWSDDDQLMITDFFRYYLFESLIKHKVSPEISTLYDELFNDDEISRYIDRKLELTEAEIVQKARWLFVDKYGSWSNQRVETDKPTEKPDKLTQTLADWQQVVSALPPQIGQIERRKEKTLDENFSDAEQLFKQALNDPNFSLDRFYRPLVNTFGLSGMVGCSADSVLDHKTYCAIAIDLPRGWGTGFNPNGMASTIKPWELLVFKLKYNL